jgi:hypothetical protein
MPITLLAKVLGAQLAAKNLKNVTPLAGFCRLL